MANFVTIALFLVLFCISAFKVQAQKTIPYDNSVFRKVVPQNPSIPLEDYIRRLPGIMIMNQGGSQRVVYRNVSSIYGENSPLFVVDGRRVGTSLAQLKYIVNVVDITSIRVMKPQDAAIRYGIRAGAGAIIIETK